MFKQCLYKGIICLCQGPEFLKINWLFLRPQLSLKNKTNTKEQLKGYLVQFQIIQISELSTLLRKFPYFMRKTSIATALSSAFSLFQLRMPKSWPNPENVMGCFSDVFRIHLRPIRRFYVVKFFYNAVLLAELPCLGSHSL